MRKPTSLVLLPDSKMRKPTSLVLLPDWKMHKPTSPVHLPDRKAHEPTSPVHLPDRKAHETDVLVHLSRTRPCTPALIRNARTLQRTAPLPESCAPRRQSGSHPEKAPYSEDKGCSRLRKRAGHTRRPRRRRDPWPSD